MMIQNPNTGQSYKVECDTITTAANKINELKGNTTWALLPHKDRLHVLTRFQKMLKKSAPVIQHQLSMETGKPEWESQSELQSAILKLDATLMSYDYRHRFPSQKTPKKTLNTIQKPLGLIGVIGPFNFPVHIPNGQILPALLTGNTVILKPSEYTTKTTQLIEGLWMKACKHIQPPIAFVYGGAAIGQQLVSHPHVDAIFFTGSSAVGLAIESTCHTLRKPCALEMGGNNPLIIDDALPNLIQHLSVSSFITAGQRCSCARRIIINKKHEGMIDKWIKAVQKLIIESYPSHTAPFMGPVVQPHIKQRLLNKKSQGLSTLLAAKDCGPGGLVSPRIDIGKHTNDDEIFGPMATITLTDSFEESIHVANQSNYGLSCSVYTSSKRRFMKAFQEINAGVINWNTPTTGASAYAAFGGTKASGNFKPGGFSMIDHCTIPVASTQSKVSAPINYPGLSA